MKIPSDGGLPERLTDYFCHHARYSPDGSYIVFDGDEGSRIYIASADGGVPIRVVPDSLPIIHSGMPSWSPNGRKITFDSEGVLMTLDLKSGEFEKIFAMDGKICMPFSWHRSGEVILTEVMDRETRKADIWMVWMDTTEDQQLTSFNSRSRKPSLSPDGRMFVFSSDHGGNADLWIMNIEGGEPVQLTFYPDSENNPGYDIEPSWSPLGDKIAFSSTRSGYWAVWVMGVDLDVLREKLNIN
jgi:Tol biopolymer transport system component